MTGRTGWGMFALLVAFIALCYLPSEQKQKQIAPDQVTMGAPATMPAFARTIHIQKDALPTAQPDVPQWTHTREAPSLRKGDMACMICLPVSLPVQAIHIATPMITARETYKATTGLHAPRNRVLLFWKGEGRSKIPSLGLT